MRIKRLPIALVNQIAAGEAIERPASVVKELLENALDAKADSISIQIYYGGLNQIKVSDNGIGIYSEDLSLAIAPHATSKISEFEDLYSIESMGFRGEALASIASISKFSILSKPQDQEYGMKLVIKDAQNFNIEPCARKHGTTIDVQDLFFNVPVRKKFLKTERLEFQAIEAVVKRFALSESGIAIDFYHNGKKILDLSAAQSEKSRLDRIQKVLGRSFLDQAQYVEVEHGDIKLIGWIGSPELQRSQNDKQWVYVNGRIIKDKLLNHAIKQGYESVLYPGRFPVCLLYLRIKPDQVDVNVHPTKHEVRFHDARWVHDLISNTIKQVVDSVFSKPVDLTSNFHNLSNSNSNSNSNSTSINLLFNEKQYLRKSFEESFGEEVRESTTSFDKKTLESHSPILNYSSNLNPLSELSPKWVNLDENFILIFLENKPVLVDALILQQKYLNDQLNKMNLPLERRDILVPVTYTFTTSLENFSARHELNLNQLGIHFTWSGEKTIIIRSLPRVIPYLNLKSFFDSLANLDKIQRDTLTEIDLLKMISRHQDFNIHYLSQQEKEKLINYFLNVIQYEEILDPKKSWWRKLSTSLYRKLLHV